jgi:fructose-1,6-bisphosphatase/inositol monophosphatase family enzyme
VDSLTLVDLLFDVSLAAKAAVDELGESGPTDRPGQYQLDVAADAVAVPKLAGAGLSVLSEESGWTRRDASLVAVLDPIDGSTNAHRGVPFYSTSICVVDTEGPWVGTVVNHATGQRFHAIRDVGAWRDGCPVHPSSCESLEKSVVGIAGYLDSTLGSWQYRALGCASLEFCSVAEGSLDAFVLGSTVDLHSWDYLAGLLICAEAGASVSELDGQNPWIASETSRRPIAAANSKLMSAILSVLAA